MVTLRQMLSGGIALWAAVAVGCTPKRAKPHPTPAASASAARAQLASAPPPSRAAEPPGAKTYRVGKAEIIQYGDPPWASPPPTSVPPASPQKYETWRALDVIDTHQTHLYLGVLDGSGRYAAVMSNMEMKVRMFDLAKRKLIAVCPLPPYYDGDPITLHLWPTASGVPRYLLGGRSGLALYDGASCRLLKLVLVGQYNQVEWTRDRRYLAVSPVETSPHFQKRVIIFKRTGDSLARALALRVREWGAPFALSVDKRLLVLPRDKVIEIYDLDSRRVRTIPYDASDIVDISPDGRQLALAGIPSPPEKGEGSLTVLDVDNPAHRARSTHFNNSINDVSFSPSGDAVVASSYDGRARIFSTDLSKPELHLRKTLRHLGLANVYAISFSDDGSRLLTTSGDRRIRLWGR